MTSDLIRVPGELNTFSTIDNIILRGICPFCSYKVTFRRRTYNLSPSHNKNSLMVGVQCEGCNSLSVFCVNEKKLYPAQLIAGLNGLPEEIQKYYDEGLRCLSADSPNGAASLFRKVIHAIGIHYGLAKKNDEKNLYKIIGELHEKEHIIKKIRDALLGIKDIGNDGAHINKNEPDMEQALKLKRLIDTVLTSTVMTDEDIDFVMKKHTKESTEKS